MEDIKYVNLIEIGSVVIIIEIRGVENSELAFPVNNTLVRHAAFLAAETRPCVLMMYNYMSLIISAAKHFYCMSLDHCGWGLGRDEDDTNFMRDDHCLNVNEYNTVQAE